MSMIGKIVGLRGGDQKMAENNKGKTTLEIIRGLSQAASNAWDGVDEKGERIKVGLKREAGDLILDKRVMDGFGVKFQGNKMCINYHAEVNMKDLHRHGPKKFEEEIEQMFNEIAKFLKKEYKKVTGSALTLTPDGETNSLVQRMSNIRNWVQSAKWYKVGNLSKLETPDDEQARSSEWRQGLGVDSAIKNFLKLGKNDKAY